MQFQDSSDQSEQYYSSRSLHDPPSGEPPQTEEAEETAEGLTRRGFLGAAGVISGAGMPTPEDRLPWLQSEDQAVAATEHEEESLPTHDHSSGREGGPSLRPGDIATADVPVVDVRSYGVVGDGETDDGAAFQAAADAATPHGVLHIPGEVDLHFKRPIDINLATNEPQNRFAFICEGALNPAPGLGDAVHIHDGRFPYVSARVEGGGLDIDVDNAVRITDTVGGFFEGYANNYDGTFYKFDIDPHAAPGLAAIVSGVVLSIGTIQTNHCGQSLYFESTPRKDVRRTGERVVSTGFIGGLGEIGAIYDYAPVRCPEFHDTGDLSINSIECHTVEDRTEFGLLFDRCLSLWFERIAVVGDAPVDNVKFENAGFMSIDSLEAVGGDRGVVVDSVTWTNIDRMSVRGNRIGVDYRQGTGNANLWPFPSMTSFNRLQVDARNNDEHGFIVREDVAGDEHHLSGRVTNNGAPMEIRSADAYIWLSEMVIAENGSGVDLSVGYEADPTGAELVVPPENSVRIYDSHVPTIAGEPKVVDHVGVASGNSETPDSSNWDVGDTVEFFQTVDETEKGVYLKLLGGDWARIDGAPAEGK